MAYRVQSGTRQTIWADRHAALAGALVGSVVPIALRASFVVGWVLAAMLFVILVALGATAGVAVVRWAFPCFELVEPWQKSRWQRLRSWTLQAASLTLAVAGIVLAVVLAPS